MNATPASALAPAACSHAAVLALRAIGLTVFDLDRTERFYRDTLDLRTVTRRRLEDSLPGRLISECSVRLAGRAGGCADDAAR